MSSGNALRMLAPKALDYPIKIIAIEVSENGGVSKGDVLVRMMDQNGKARTIKAPFDCRISSVLASADDVLEAPAPLLELQKIDERAEPPDVENGQEEAPFEPAPKEEQPEVVVQQSREERVAPAPEQRQPEPVGEPVEAGAQPEVPEPWAKQVPPIQRQSSDNEEPASEEEKQKSERIAEILAKYQTPPRSDGGPRAERTENSSSESLDLGKRLPFMLLLLIAPPAVLFGVLYMLGILPTELIVPPRRPGIFFLIQNPSVLLAAVVGFSVPLLLYLYMPAPREGKWDGKFQVGNIGALIIGFFATMAVALTPPHDLLTLMGLEDGPLFERTEGNSAAKKTNTARRTTSTEPKQAKARKYTNPEAVAARFVNKHAWLDSPRITPSVYSTFPAEKFPEFRNVSALVAMGGNASGATLIGLDNEMGLYATIYDTEKSGIVLFPQFLGRTNALDLILSPTSDGRTVFGNSYMEVGQKGYGVQDFQIIGGTKKPQQARLRGIENPGQGEILASHNIKGLGARIRTTKGMDGESVVIDVLNGDGLATIPGEEFGFPDARDIYLERHGPDKVSLAVLGSDYFGRFSCQREGGCSRVSNLEQPNEPGTLAAIPKNYKPMHGVVRSNFVTRALSFHRYTLRFDPEVVIGDMAGYFGEEGQFGAERQSGRKIRFSSVFIRQKDKVRYFPVEQKGKVSSKLVDVETLPNDTGYALLISGERLANGESSWVVLVGKDLEPRAIWSNSNESYQDIMATGAGQLIVVGRRHGTDGRSTRPVFAELPL